MPEKHSIERARKDARRGKAPSTQAGEFVREEIEHIREGRHGAASAKQAIAIGLSKARRAGVKLRPPREGTTSRQTRRRAQRDLERSHTRTRNRRRSRASLRALRRKGRSAASSTALARQARTVARKRSAAARKAARTRARAG